MAINTTKLAAIRDAAVDRLKDEIDNWATDASHENTTMETKQRKVDTLRTLVRWCQYRLGEEGPTSSPDV
jgi:hypothetical protein